MRLITSLGGSLAGLRPNVNRVVEREAFSKRINPRVSSNLEGRLQFRAISDRSVSSWR